MRVSLISALVTAFLGGMAAVARPAMAQEFPLLPPPPDRAAAGLPAVTARPGW